MLSVELEMDSFNNHECMAHLCAVIKYLSSENMIGSAMKVTEFFIKLLDYIRLIFYFFSNILVIAAGVKKDNAYLKT